MSFDFKSVKNIVKMIEDPSAHSKLGSYRFDPSEISDSKVKKLWWALENNNPAARVALAKAARSAKPGRGSGDQILSLSNVIVEKSTVALAEALEQVADEDAVDFAGYEALEAAIAMGDGFIETRDAEKQLRSLSRNKTIKNELTAKQAFQKCVALKSSHLLKDHKKAAEGFKQIAARFPDTVYGQKSGRG